MIAISSDAMQLAIDGALVKISFDHLLIDSQDAHKTLVSMLKKIPK